jgi:hypothetical protein
MSRPGNLSIKSGDGLQSDQKKQKTRFTCLERLATYSNKGLEIAKAGSAL